MLKWLDDIRINVCDNKENIFFSYIIKQNIIPKSWCYCGTWGIKLSYIYNEPPPLKELTQFSCEMKNKNYFGNKPVTNVNI